MNPSSNDLFIENILEDKLQRIKEQINQSHMPSVIRENDEAMLKNQFKKYQIDLANMKRRELENNVEDWDKKLRDISKVGMMGKEEGDAKRRNNMQVIQNKPLKSNCRVMNEEIENELEANAQDFVKKLRKDKQQRIQRERDRLERNVEMYMMRQERSCDAAKKNNNKQMPIGTNGNIPPQFNQHYGLYHNNSNSKLIGNHNRMKSPSLGIFYAPLPNSEKKKKTVQGQVSPSSLQYNYNYNSGNAYGYGNNNSIASNQNINTSSNQGYSIHYMIQHDYGSKSYIELNNNNQRRTPYYFNEPKYASIVKSNYSKLHSEKTEGSIQ